MQIPQDIMFSQTHEWIKKEGDIVIVGITEFAVQQLSDLIYIDLPKVGELIKAGEPLGEVESVKAVSDINAPVSGEVVEINNSVTSNLDLITKEPYGAGWLIKIKLSDQSELKKLLSADDYDNLCKTEH